VAPKMFRVAIFWLDKIGSDLRVPIVVQTSSSLSTLTNFEGQSGPYPYTRLSLSAASAAEAELFKASLFLPAVIWKAIIQ